MKKRVIIGTIAVVVLLCTGLIIGAGGAGLAVAKSPQSPNVDAMIVFYRSSNSTYLFWCDMAETDIVDRGDKWDVYSPQGTWIGVNKANVTYGYFKYKKIDPDYEGTIDDLHLVPLSGMELPKSQHIGKLTAVNPALAKPATVTRKYDSQLYDVQCLVSQDIVDMWQAGDLQIGDYVIVSYIDEIPETQEVSVAIVTDKVYESW